MPRKKTTKNAKNGAPQEHLSGEMLARKMEVTRKQNIVEQKLYPALLKATISIDEAKMLVKALSAFMMEDVMDFLRSRQFADVSDKLLIKLSPDGERKEELKALLNVFHNENLAVAREILEGLGGAIDQMINDEMKNRKLETLKVDWNRILAR